MNQDAPNRPDPDALLAEAKRQGRGRLRVYLGMAPGVGKTYEMLTAGKRREKEGVDVVVGVVETHGRKDTEAMIAGLEVLPRQPIEYRGRQLMEFDLDGALARRPKLLLVDEYAHTNAPGSRHPKRWQDVEELLEAGIDVWTTLNVQHLESLVDVVWKITGVRVRETVPDSALSAANEIEVVDITPDELRERLNAGKVYVPETARVAATNFFKPENLTALREMALRRAAQTVDDQMVDAMRRQGIEGPWAAGERILVLIAGDGMSSALVRAGRRLADLMNAPWTVANVERPNRPNRDPQAARRVAEALKLAEQLGGASVVLTGDDLPDAVLAFAGRNNVTQIVVGKSRDSRWRILTGRSLANALLRRSGGAALHFVTAGAPEERTAPVETAPRRRPHWWRGYAAALVLVALANGAAFVLDAYSTGADLAMIFLASVLGAGLAYGLRPALAAAGLAIVTYNYLFLEPRFTLVIGHATDVFTFAIFIAVAGATGWLSGRVRDQAQLSAQRASAVTALLAASRRLSAASTQDETAQALAEQASAAAGGRAVVLLPKGEDLVQAAGAPTTVLLTTGALAAARWAWEKGEPAGAGTGTLPQVGWTFRPLVGVRGRAGVAGVEVGDTAGADEERLVSAMLDQGAVALERAELAAATVENEALRRSDKLRAALLNSISHDLRTPLATVMGSATTLIDYGKTLKPEVRGDLLISIREEAERLNRYVGDLLDMTRLEGGALKTRSEWTDVRDVLAAAVGRVSRRLESRKLTRDFPHELSAVETDPGLLEQAIVNILENAIAYSPDGSAIDVAAYEDRGNVVISIEDEGPGIPQSDIERIFEKFRRLEEPSDRTPRGDRNKGAGLGLSIAKGFVEAMGGRIAAASPLVAGRGTRILISLPKATPTHRLLL
ncbi:MAG TPA: sensor histidine kinase KdpD [Caulobacteraceae bacterium]|jgi:two-component system sensor histidine kinase KdpD|nr:sensor histidine kinase KdpD [Caulobacteraceae bacterium]